MVEIIDIVFVLGRPGRTSMTIANSSVGFAPATQFRVGASSHGFRPSARIQTNVLARSERKLLDRLCSRLPEWVTPDLLTALGVFGAVMTAAGYVASNVNRDFLFVASLGLILNWFGDSLDGSLARYREAERHRYGFFVDHSMDAVSILIICVGLGLSPYVGMAAALFTLVGYLLLGLFVFLCNHVTGAIRLSFLGCGPTELRLLIIVFNLALFLLGPVSLHVMGRVFSLHSASVGAMGLVLIGLFVFNVYRTAADLKRYG
jgi:archaetidylinositol phosphate synthase